MLQVSIHHTSRSLVVHTRFALKTATVKHPTLGLRRVPGRGLVKSPSPLCGDPMRAVKGQSESSSGLQGFLR